MKKRLALIVSAFLILGLTFGMSYTHKAEATVPGTNAAVNYDSTNTNLVATSGNSHIRITEDGGTIAWYSSSRSIVPGDTGSGYGMYVKNLQTGVTTIADTDLSGSHGWIADPRFVFSRTGRYVVFSSNSTNMVVNPTVPSSPVQAHIYLKDMQLGTTTLVDQTSTGTLANIGANTGTPFPASVSDDGRFVSFFSQANNLLSADNPASPSYGSYYVKDLQTGQIISPDVVSPGTRANSSETEVAASCDGSLMVFSSNATNRTAQDNGKFNTYLLDLRNGYSVTNLTYNADNGAKPKSISCNGRYIVLSSTSTNLTADSVSGSNSHWFRYDRLTGTYSLVDKSTSGYISSTYSPIPAVWGGQYVSDNGLVLFADVDKYLVSPNAINANETYLRNPDAGTTELVPVNSSGTEQSPAPTGSVHTLEISSRGDSVIYDSRATNLVPGVTLTSPMVVLSKVQ